MPQHIYLDKPSDKSYNSNTARTGIGLCGVTFVVLLIGKIFANPTPEWLTWWVVFLPIYGPVLLSLAILTLVLLIAGIAFDGIGIFTLSLIAYDKVFGKKKKHREFD